MDNKLKKMFDIDFAKTIINKKCFEAIYNNSGPCSICNFKGQHIKYRKINYKNKEFYNKTRMIEWNDKLAYINFFTTDIIDE